MYRGHRQGAEYQGREVGGTGWLRSDTVLGPRLSFKSDASCTTASRADSQAKKKRSCAVKPHDDEDGPEVPNMRA